MKNWEGGLQKTFVLRGTCLEVSSQVGRKLFQPVDCQEVRPSHRSYLRQLHCAPTPPNRLAAWRASDRLSNSFGVNWQTSPYRSGRILLSDWELISTAATAQ